MILPDTPLFQAKSDAEFRIRMVHYIKTSFKDILSKEDIKMLELPNGLDILQARINQRLYDASRGEIDMRKPELARQAA